VGTILGALIGIPVAIYLAEFSSSRLRNTLRPAIEVLNGFPSIIMGMLVLVLFCFAIMARYGVNTMYSGSGLSLLAAMIVIGIMSIPIIVSISEDSLRAVPNELREASFGLGATKWQTSIKVLVPSALSGISVSILISLLDAMGETMAVLMVIGQMTPPPITLNPLYAGNVITSKIASVVSGGETMGLNWFFGLAVLLFIMTLFMNLAVRMVKRRISRMSGLGRN
jgi:ABC-type phosphate transport system permease subunit